MLPFLRPDLAQLKAYTPHPASAGESLPPAIEFDQLDTNESPVQLPDELKAKLAWTYQHTIATNRYPDGGHDVLKQAVVEYIQESSHDSSATFTTSHISLGNGSDELIRALLIATCLGGAGAILVAEPTFSMYGILARTLGIPVVTVGRSDTTFETNLAAAQEAIEDTQNPPIRAVFIVHPNSPTGNALTTAELDWLRSLPEHILVVVDEAYFEFSQTTVVHEVLARSNWVILRTFSKAFRLAAHRVGYAIGHPDLITALEKVRLPYNLPTFSQAAAHTALLHRHLLLDSIPALLQERSQLITALRQFPQLQVWDSSANFVYIRLKSPLLKPDTALAQITQEMKIQGTLIRHTGGGLRITIGTAAENQRTLERLNVVLHQGNLVE